MTDSATLLWVRALHIIAMVCWFAGIFYLPRLFVNHAMTDEAPVKERLAQMEMKLYRFTTPFAWLTICFGLWMLVARWSYYANAYWMHAKIVLVLLLVAYHIECGRIVRRFARNANARSHVFYRWFNELPVIVLFGSIILVIVKPF